MNKNLWCTVSDGNQYWFQIFRNATSSKQWYLQNDTLDVCRSLESTLIINCLYCWFQQGVKYDTCPCNLFPSLSEQVTCSYYGWLHTALWQSTCIWALTFTTAWMLQASNFMVKLINFQTCLSSRSVQRILWKLLW